MQFPYHSLFAAGNTSTRFPIRNRDGTGLLIAICQANIFTQRGDYGIFVPIASMVRSDPGFSRSMAEDSNCTPCKAEDRVRKAGLRPTRQRIALAELLFAQGNRHLAAEELHAEAENAGYSMSLATVYNTLHQFTDAGMLRVLAVEGARTYFDTNTSDHHHYFIENDNTIFDIEGAPFAIENLPEPPEGMEIANVDVVIRLRRKKA